MKGCSASLERKSFPLRTRKPPAGIIFGDGTRYFFGALKSSVRNHPLISAGVEERFCNSTHATPLPCGRVIASSMTTLGNSLEELSGCPGGPLKTLPARQLDCRFNLSGETVSSFNTSAKPAPSVIFNHASL